jgi:hypothetical protein
VLQVCSCVHFGVAKPKSQKGTGKNYQICLADGGFKIAQAQPASARYEKLVQEKIFMP